MNHYSKKSWASPRITRVALLSDAQVKPFTGSEQTQGDPIFGDYSSGPVS